MIKVQLWWITQSLLFKNSPQFAYNFRAKLLRLFGARVGTNVLIRPSVRVTYPWKVSIGDYSWVGDNVELYSLGNIVIGAHSVISQRSYICSADHDHTTVDFAIRARNVNIGSGCWIATDCFIAPGVTIGDNTVIGARSSVFRDMPAEAICKGSPCQVTGKRVMNANEPLSSLA